MNNTVKYSPTCKNKKAELLALGKRSREERKYIEPIIVVAPLIQEDTNTIPLLDTKRVPDIVKMLDLIGLGYRSFIDFQPALDKNAKEFGRDWASPAFRRAREAGHDVAPCIRALETTTYISDYKAVIDTMGESRRVGVIIEADDVEELDFVATLNSLISQLDVSHSEVTLIVDFTKLDLSQSGAIEIVSVVLETLDDLGAWNNMIFRGGSFPDHYPSKGKKKDRKVLTESYWDNHEAILWPELSVRANEFNSSLSFGDFLAEGPQFSFTTKKGGSRAYNALRWASPDGLGWFFRIGSRVRKPREEMPEIAASVIKSEHFDLNDISEVASTVLKMARSEFCGTSSSWRRIATTRHIDVTLSQLLGKVQKAEGAKTVQFPPENLELFD